VYWSADQPSSTRSSTATPSPCPSPLAPPEPHDTPQTTFSTWLPDDSLRFINPRFLSTDEKETLQSQLGKRKSEEDEDHAGADQRGRSSILQADEGCSVPAKQSTLSSPTAIQSRTSRPTPTKHLPHPVMPSATDLSAVLAPSRSTLSRPSLGPRSRTTDLDLLRQVKSNNLSLPATSLYPPPYQSQPSPPYTLPPAYKVPPSSLPPRHPPHAYPLPFTHAPLVHPPLGDTGRQYHPPPSGNERLFARPQHGQYIFRPQHVQHTRVVHPPPAPVRWEESRSTTFPSVLQPISPPRHTYPQPTYPPDQVRQPKGGTSLSRQIPEVDRSPGKEGQGRVSAVEHRELG
jgi:hypothetical protein